MSLILQLDAHGQPNKWTTWQTATIFHSKGQVIWTAGDQEYLVRGGTNRVSGQQSTITTAPIIAVRGEPGTSRRAWTHPTLNNRELFRRDRHQCAYCGRVAGDLSLSRDHVIPRSRGGADTWQNCVTACLKCNSKKSNKTLEAAGLTLLYVPYVPSHAEHLILCNRTILACQMEFLLSFVDQSKPSRVFSGHGAAVMGSK